VGARGSVVRWGAILQAGRSWDRVPMRWIFSIYLILSRAIAQAVSHRLPTAAARVRVRTGMLGLWWTKRHWVRFSASTSVSPTNHHPTNFSIIIITRGRHYRPIGGRSAEWTKLDSTPSLYPFKNNTLSFQPHYGPGVDLACNRNEYQESSWGVKGDRRIGVTTLLPSVSRLSDKMWEPRRLTTLWAFTACYRDSLT
jgi:hypothetical protein